MKLLGFYIIYSIFWCIGLLPMFILYRISDVLYILVYYIIGYRKKVVYNNLSNAFPEKSYKEKKAIAKKFYLHLCDVLVEIIALIHMNEKQIKKLGFEFESFGGNSILIQSVPEIITKKSVKNELREIIDKLINEDSIINSADMVSEMIEFMACRSAIKADEKLNNTEIKKIVTDLFKSTNPFRCPHGRPILIKMSRTDIDKGVGR